MNFNDIKDCYTLNNGVKIPCLGFGTWNIPDSISGVDTIKTALDCGYRHIDTASGYHNERAVGMAVRSSGIPKEEIFVTSKLSNEDRGDYNGTLKSFEKTMDRLGLDYVDLYLIHWPKPYALRDRWAEMNNEAWGAFEELYNKGLIKAIGVSNFLTNHFNALDYKIEPMVNQLELHPCYIQPEIYNFCAEKGIVAEAYSPLIQGRAFELKQLSDIAEKHSVTVSQVCLRWSLQMGFLPLPKASSKERMLENADLFKFSLDEEDMEKISELKTIGRTGAHPDNATF